MPEKAGGKLSLCGLSNKEVAWGAQAVEWEWGHRELGRGGCEDGDMV